MLDLFVDIFQDFVVSYNWGSLPYRTGRNDKDFARVSTVQSFALK